MVREAVTHEPIPCADPVCRSRVRRPRRRGSTRLAGHRQRAGPAPLARVFIPRDQVVAATTGAESLPTINDSGNLALPRQQVSTRDDGCRAVGRSSCVRSRSRRRGARTRPGDRRARSWRPAHAEAELLEWSMTEKERASIDVGEEVDLVSGPCVRPPARSHEGQRLHGWRPGRRRRWRVRGKTEVSKDSADRRVVSDEGKEPAQPAALAEEDIDVEHTAHQV